jgi:hypothetical protein
MTCHSDRFVCRLWGGAFFALPLLNQIISYICKFCARLLVQIISWGNQSTQIAKMCLGNNVVQFIQTFCYDFGNYMVICRQSYNFISNIFFFYYWYHCWIILLLASNQIDLQSLIYCILASAKLRHISYFFTSIYNSICAIQYSAMHVYSSSFFPFFLA